MEENKKPEIPQAFPNTIVNDHGIIITGQNGMSLRDYFANSAMQYFISANNGNFSKNDASQIFYIADTMLKQRKL